MKEIALAAIRMNAEPAPTESRLERAERLVAQAATQGAQIAVLPELFNIGYKYQDANYALAEPIEGQTLSWMKSAAKKYDLHIAGALLILDGDDIYNTLVLVSPSGQRWRYEKTFPWAWERAYFKPGRTGTVVAETELGKFGLLICWDVAHANLWAEYAGKVDAMLVSSCPPLMNQLDYHFPDGRVVATDEFGPVMRRVYKNSNHIFGEFFRRQAAWLGVPSVNTTGGGIFRTKLPRPKFSMAVLLAARPDLWKYISQADEVFAQTGYFSETFVADQQGNVLARTERDGDDLAIAPVHLPASSPNPQSPQPPSGLSPLAYHVDAFSNAMLVRLYEKMKTTAQARP